MDIRAIRRKARTDLNNAFRVPAIYVPLNGAAVSLHVRDHTRFRVNAIEGVRSGSGQPVDRQEMAPSLIFMRSELSDLGLTLIKGGIVSIEADEAYRLDSAEAPDDITVKWFVTAITDKSKLASMPLPGDG